MGAANRKKHTEARSLHWRKFLKTAGRCCCNDTFMLEQGSSTDGSLLDFEGRIATESLKENSKQRNPSKFFQRNMGAYHSDLQIKPSEVQPRHTCHSKQEPVSSVFSIQRETRYKSFPVDQAHVWHHRVCVSLSPDSRCGKHRGSQGHGKVGTKSFGLPFIQFLAGW
jgi:hypothetical protein